VHSFFKQWGSFQNPSSFNKRRDLIVLNDGQVFRSSDEADEEAKLHWSDFAPTMTSKVGKNQSGALLDGRSWREMPR